MTDWIGYRWLAEHYGVTPVQAFRTVSSIAGSRSSLTEEGRTTRFHAPPARPDPTLDGHLTFALKHEGVHLEFLARLFARIESAEIERWVASAPTGQYARRAGFFYEWLTCRTLSSPDTATGNYVGALDPTKYVVASAPTRNRRWRVLDNLPGTRAYCPLIERTARVSAAEAVDCASRLQALEAEFGADLLLRSAVWLTVKESRASFAIEHEEMHTDRVKRFAAVMEKRCGAFEDPLSEETLRVLQREILGPRATRYGVRRSPVFVGEVDSYVQVVHYIAPHWEQIPDLLDGLRRFFVATHGGSPLVRAAVMSFGFVYLHPMADGNGRISRFLINDVLRRDGAVPAPFILPVSATIVRSVANRRGYDQVLALFSRPFMRRYLEAWHFGAERTGADGVRYDLDFDAYDDALAAWRYPDFTDHVEYLGAVIEETLGQEMRKEAAYLRGLRQARERIKAVIEGPDADIDRIIRSVRESGDSLSGRIVKEFPALVEPAVAEAVIDAVHRAFSRAREE